MTAEPGRTAAPDEAVPRPRRRRWPAWLAAGALSLMVLALVVLWLDRRTLASDAIDRALSKRGVPARYRIADFGLGRQRLVDVAIGDPAHPDLVADWIEVGEHVGLDGVALRAVRAGHVRLRGRLVDGRVSLGSIDRLLPPPSGKPFALPDIDLTVADARLRLATPAGPLALRLTGSGRLTDGFRGTLSAAAERLAPGACTLVAPRADLHLAIDAAQPHLTGPVRLAALDCAGVRARTLAADLDVTLAAQLDRWTGQAVVKVARTVRSSVSVTGVGGTIGFDGSARSTRGSLDLASRDFAAPGVSGATLGLSGAYRVERGFTGFSGTVSTGGAALDAADRSRLAAIGDAAAGTPVGPVAARIGQAAASAAGHVDATATLALVLRGDRAARIAIDRFAAASASGAHAAMAGAGLMLDRTTGAIAFDGRLELNGGGLPHAVLTVDRRRSSDAVTGVLRMDPYAADDAGLSLRPVRFAATADAARFATVATISGPVAGGRIDALMLPLAGMWQGGRLTIDPGCVPLAFRRVQLAGLALDPARLRLCPTGAALLSVGAGGTRGGVTIAAPALTGRLGRSPLSLSAATATLSLSDRMVALGALTVAIGPADRQTVLRFDRLAGGATGGALAGTFAGGTARIGAVPLDLSQAAGDWRFAGGALDVRGALRVADTAATARFLPLAGRDVHLTLANDRIAATGTLVAPGSGTRIADVALAHDLASGRGGADLDVPGITFTKNFQPDALTPVTFGVIADVAGTVAGHARIDWSDTVTSTGTFRTANMNLAAAFGPVTGLSTTIRFTDLLNMVTAPHQAATIAEINPGVPVDQGVVHYRVNGPTELVVEDARWPFAGGTLTLEPTTLDFGADQARHMTFRIAGVDAQRFLQQFDFKNIDATGTFDGVLPMVFDADGGQIRDGALTVRRGGGTVAYVGDLTQKDLGFWGDMAFQALKSLRYDRLSIAMNGPLSGEMVTQVRFAGVRQGRGTRTNFLVRRLMRLPFVFNVTIRAPFRQLVSSAESLYDPTLLPQGKVQELLQQQPSPPAPIQPPESETRP